MEKSFACAKQYLQNILEVIRTNKIEMNEYEIKIMYEIRNILNDIELEMFSHQLTMDI